MIPRQARETQRAYVERVLAAEGEFATYDALYNLRYEDGQKCSITRLAAIVCQLREAGWEIATAGEHGETARYRLVATPRAAAPAPLHWSAAWRCAECGGRPIHEPAPLLGDLGRAYCEACHAARYFRRAA